MGSWVGKGIAGSSDSCNAAEQDYVGVPRVPLQSANNCSWNEEELRQKLQT